MKFIPYIFFLLSTVCTFSRPSVYTEVKGNEDKVLSFLKRSVKDNVEYNELHQPKLEINPRRQKDLQDVRTALAKAKVLKKFQNHQKDYHSKNYIENQEKSVQRYRVDPVLNFLTRRYVKKPKHDEDSISTSSSMEMQEWKDEWKEHWIQKKFEAINSSQIKGDTVNMLAARPWGVPCGDPNQHDMPWGTCMLPMECEAEFRIYRGDFYCGRTQFVCCALQETAYDLYQGFDVSFASTSLETDSDEKKDREKGSREQRRKRKWRDRRRRQRERMRRKKQIKKDIKRIVKEIKRILSRSYRNTTTNRKRKTKELKEFVKTLKKQYRDDRKSVKNLHEWEIMKIDAALAKELQHIKGMNKEFIGNQTFKDIIVNGTVSPAAMRMLVEAYPDLVPMLENTRRSNDIRPKTEYLNYDIDYGLLYY